MPDQIAPDPDDLTFFACCHLMPWRSILPSQLNSIADQAHANWVLWALYVSWQPAAQEVLENCQCTLADAGLAG